VNIRTTRIAAALAAAMLALPIAACGASDTGAEGPVTIRFNWWGSDTRAKLQQEVIDKFEAKYPDIKVETETSNYDDYITKLSTAAASGTLPDVMTMVDPFVYDYMDTGSLLDLSTASEQLDLSAFPEDSFSDVLGEQGEKYAVSLGSAGHGLAINPAVFEKYGVAIPDDETWSWEDFEKAAKEISEKSDGDAVGLNLEPTEQIANCWVRQQGQWFGMGPGGEPAVNFDAATLAGYLQFEKKLIDEGATNSPDQMQELSSAGASPEQSLLAQDKAGISLISMNQLSQFEEAAGHELQPVLWPGETQAPARGGWVKQSQYLAISANTAHPEAAATFVDYLVNDEEAGTIMGLDRGVPVNPNVLKAVQADTSGADQRFAEWVERSNAVNTQPFYRLNTGAAAALSSGAYSRAHEALIFGQSSPEQAAEAFKGELESAATN